LPWNARLPWKARSEFANPIMLANMAAIFGSGGASGLGGGAFGSGSGGIGPPAGTAGSKKPSGFGMLDTFSMPRAASPASRRPPFSPTRGSFAAGFC
jgi:hypothetical protein